MLPGMSQSVHTQSAAPPELLTISEACDLLRIKRRTLDDWRAAKRIPCIEIGRWVRFRRADVEAFLSAHTVAPRTAQTFRRRQK